jgi:hypothetical protein
LPNFIQVSERRAILIEKWRSLPPEKKQEIIDFVKFLEFRSGANLARLINDHDASKPASNLGGKFQEIRNKIVSSGMPLLDWEGVECEKVECRGGY